MNRIIVAIGLVILGLTGTARAEGGCPDGYQPMPEQYTDPASGTLQVRMNCVPAGAAKQQQDTVWADRWGAISIDGTVSNGGIGTVTGYPSKRAAEKAALAQCRANGGTKACKINLSYHNQCSVIAWGDTYLTTQGGPTVEVASSMGLASCNQKTSNCTIYYSGCSLPERVR